MGAGQGMAAVAVAVGIAGSAASSGDEVSAPRYTESERVSTSRMVSEVESGRYGLDSWALKTPTGYSLPTPTTIAVTDGLARFGQSGTCQEDEPCWDWRTMGNRQRGVCASGVWMIQNPDGSLQRTNAAGVDVTGWPCREGMATVG